MASNFEALYKKRWAGQISPKHLKSPKHLNLGVSAKGLGHRKICFKLSRYCPAFFPIALRKFYEIVAPASARQRVILRPHGGRNFFSSALNTRKILSHPQVYFVSFGPRLPAGPAGAYLENLRNSLS